MELCAADTNSLMGANPHAVSLCPTMLQAVGAGEAVGGHYMDLEVVVE